MSSETSRESAEDAKNNALENLQKAIISIPQKLRLKIENLPKNIDKVVAGKTEKLRVLFKTIDQTNEQLGQFAACKKGCSSCCYIPVSISESEIEYIEKYTGAKRTRIQPAEVSQGKACPFLLNGECSIYEHRPYSCRRHMAFTKTAHWCRPGIYDRIDMPNAYSETRDEFPTIHQNYVNLAGTSRWDIRQVFSASALQNGPIAAKNTCYHCGKPATSKEHIPPKCIFPTNSRYRKDLITVPACDEHNTDKALEDEFIMACVTPSVLNNNLAIAETRTRLKATLDKKPGLLAATMKNIKWFEHEKSGIVLAEADVPRLTREFELMARGLYFYEKRRRFEGTCTVLTNFVVFRELEDRMLEACRATIKKLVDKEKTAWEWQGANKEVFAYHLEENDGIGMVVLRFFEGVEVYIGLRSTTKIRLDDVLNTWPSCEELKQIQPKSKTQWNTVLGEFEKALKSDAILTRLVRVRNYPEMPRHRDPHHMVVLWQYLGEGKMVSELIKTIGPKNIFGLHGYALSEMAEYGLVEGTDTKHLISLARLAGHQLDPNDIQQIWNKRLDELLAMGAQKPCATVNSDPLARWIAFVLMATPKREYASRGINAFEASLHAAQLLQR